ncbi:hypothetical protein HDV02_000353, partial [Globomyces sp. JEL0801]
MQFINLSALVFTFVTAIPQPVSCPEIYAPVCAKLNGNQSTYDNDCLAKSAGAEIVHKGKCIATCPEILAPVCANLNGIKTTYDNDCLAKSAGA